MSFLTNSLSTLPDVSTLVTWQNNVTRLNQSNLNNMTSGISSVITSLKGFGADVTNYFTSIDTEISTLKDKDTALTQAIQENTDFRESHSEDFEGLTEVFRYQYNQNKVTPYAGIVYSNANYPLVIQSQSSPLELKGTLVKINGNLKLIEGSSIVDSYDNSITDFSKLRFTTETYIAKGPADYANKSLMV